MEPVKVQKQGSDKNVRRPPYYGKMVEKKDKKSAYVAWHHYM